MHVSNNCDGSGPHTGTEVRRLPFPNGNLILCRSDYDRQMKWRRDRNRELADDCKYDLPAWDSLEVYGEEDTPQGYTIEESNGIFKVYCDEWRNHGHGLVGWGPTREVAIQIAKTAAEGEASRAARKAAKGK